MPDFVSKSKMDWGEPIINFKFEENKMFETRTTTDTRVEDPVNHPSHYTDCPTLGRLECLDITRWLPFDLGNAFKYVWRAGNKNPEKMVEDLEKARFYLYDWKELQTWQKTLYHGRACAEMMFFKADCKQFVSWRYRALRAIVRGDADEALDIVLGQIAFGDNDVDDEFAHGYQPEDETDED